MRWVLWGNSDTYFENIVILGILPVTINSNASTCLLQKTSFIIPTFYYFSLFLTENNFVFMQNILIKDFPLAPPRSSQTLHSHPYLFSFYPYLGKENKVI